MVPSASGTGWQPCAADSGPRSSVQTASAGSWPFSAADVKDSSYLSPLGATPFSSVPVGCNQRADSESSPSDSAHAVPPAMAKAATSPIRRRRRPRIISDLVSYASRVKLARATGPAAHPVARHHSLGATDVPLVAGLAAVAALTRRAVPAGAVALEVVRAVVVVVPDLGIRPHERPVGVRFPERMGAASEEDFLQAVGHAAGHVHVGVSSGNGRYADDECYQRDCDIAILDDRSHALLLLSASVRLAT